MRLPAPAGDDLTCLGKGNDVYIGNGINADDVHDEVYGGPGRDQLNGGVGDDKLFAGAGDDHPNQDPFGFLSGGSGFDQCNGGKGLDAAFDSCEAQTGVEIEL